MPEIENLSLTQKRKMTVFFLLETSGRMNGEKLAILNHTMEEYIRELENLKEDLDLEIIAVEFNSGANLITENGPVKIEDFEWKYVENGGLADLGAALRELCIQIEKNMKCVVGMCWPVFVFMLTGCVTDNYESVLVELRENIFFKRGIKVAVAIGNDVNLRILSDIVGNSEAVIRYTDIDLFRRVFRVTELPSDMLDMIIDEELDNYKKDIDDAHIVQQKSKVFIHLPENDITLYDGESYQCAYCEILPCSPEKALIIALEIKYIDNGGGNEILEVKNCCLENIYLSHIYLWSEDSKVEQGDIISMNTDEALFFKRQTMLLTFEIEKFGATQDIFENDDEW